MIEQSIRSKNNQISGFTIVEVLVSIVVFAMLAVSITVLFSSMQASQRNAQYLSIATQEARARIEIMRADYSNLVNGTTTFPLPDTLPAGSIGKVVVSDAGVGEIKRLQVSVAFAGRQVELEALATKEGAL
ncbi:prepilin-type N-terminal cleavage/methylation domain-containing protein [Candidatus Saccharibacteria bacterium]|nr:prepilin-type N-terminal cleavage/methylation domain-containing protein [Candidatus Saccharibacteria bacterium]MBH1972416.1 prepilin-type N-terminal cleavage/methylation domain-containing protein [Candidatus Saccharibacteria bacterium]MBH1990242.1 prepilin-type N-terminal cleavage/methylation domain-containing protein [Candidatus Saccharibacteria bacterium]